MRKISLTYRQYSILGLVLTILMLSNFWFTKNIAFGVTCTTLYFVYFGYLLGKKILSQQTTFWQVFWGVLALTSLYLCLLSIIYWFYIFTNSIASDLIVVISVLILHFTKSKNLEITLPKINKDEVILTLIPAGLYVLLLAKALSRRYGDTLISPWTVMGPRFFLVFFIATFLLFFVLKKSRSVVTKLILILLHFTTYLGIILLLYKHGFGFDAFIHQSSEKNILEYGLINPKQPYYIGQYMLTLFFHGATNIPLDITDRILVPIGASVVLPLSTYFVFVKEKRLIGLVTLALMSLLLLPFFTFTTPNNLSLLFGYLVFTWIWYEKETSSKTTHLVGLLLSASACAIHPFIGLPVLGIYLGSLAYKYKQSGKSIHLAYGLGLTFLLPLILFLNAMRLGQGLTLHNPINRLTPFYKIFTTPHWFIFDNASIKWQLLYTYRLALGPIIVVLMLAGVLLFLKRNPNSKFYPLTLVSLFISSFLLSTTIEFPGVISYEQGVYAQRLLILLFVFLIPFFLIIIQEIYIKVKDKYFIFSVSAAFLIIISFYFNYPTRDPVSFHTGYQVRDADIEAINFIHNLNNKDATQYTVLSNQTVAAAVIKELGFLQYHTTADGPQFFYSIPTGGPMYQYFRKMVYEEPKNEWMQQAMDYVGVERAYFIHTNYWAPAAKIRDQAKKTASSWWELADGRVWVFEYRKN